MLLEGTTVHVSKGGGGGEAEDVMWCYEIFYNANVLILYFRVYMYANGFKIYYYDKLVAFFHLHSVVVDHFVVNYSVLF